MQSIVPIARVTNYYDTEFKLRTLKELEQRKIPKQNLKAVVELYGFHIFRITSIHSSGGSTKRHKIFYCASCHNHKGLPGSSCKMGVKFELVDDTKKYIPVG